MRRGLLQRKGRRRGAILLELVMTVPFSIILVFLTVDIGRYVLAKSALHDAAAVSARAGARTGTLGQSPSSGAALDCGTPKPERQVYNAFCESAANMPGLDINDVRLDVSLTNASGGSRDGEFCESDGGYIYVRTESSASMEFLIDSLPLDEMLGLENGLLGGLFANGVPANMRRADGTRPAVIYVSATARCEVAR
jgi:hypothetical protein